MSASHSSTGWAGSDRVNTTDGRDVEHDAADVVPRVSGFDWPSEDAPAVWVEFATRDEASEISSFAREQLMGWLAGGGLHPVVVSYRWVIACCFLRIDQEAGIVRKMMGMHGGGLGLGKWERHVIESIKPAEPWRETLKRIDDNLGNSARLGRYVPQTDERSIAEVLDWVAEESVEMPFCFGEDEVEGLENDAREIGRASMRLLCRWLSLSGTDLLSVLKRFNAMAFERYKLIAGAGKMTGEDFSDLVLQVRATFCEEMKRYFSEPCEILLGYVPKTAGQKSAAASAVYAANAAVNCPRRQLSGDAGLDRCERDAVCDADALDETAAEAEARAVSADWLAAQRAVDYGEVKFPLVNARQREFKERLTERLAADFVESVTGGSQG